MQRPGYTPANSLNSILIKFSESTTIEEQDMICAGLNGAYVEREYSFSPGLVLVRLPDGVSVKNANDHFLCDGRDGSPVDSAEENALLKVSLTPDDPQISTGLNFTDGVGDINAFAAWDIVPPPNSDICSSAVVAIIDTGAKYDHEDLAANMWVNPSGGGCGYDFVNNDELPADDFGHGTHVAGIIGAVGNNATGVCGVNFNAKMMILKAGDSNGDLYASNIAAAFDYAITYGARVINCSFGAYGVSSVVSSAVIAAEFAGILVVCAAGNNRYDTDTTPTIPASYENENIISVLGTNTANKIASFSNYGKTSVDVGAPSVDIISTLSNGSYGLKSGTSMATPFVSGIASYIMAVCPTLTAAQVKESILETCEPITAGGSSVDPADLCVSGGRVDMEAALTYAIALSAGGGSVIVEPIPAYTLNENVPGREVVYKRTSRDDNDMLFDMEVQIIWRKDTQFSGVTAITVKNGLITAVTEKGFRATEAQVNLKRIAYANLEKGQIGKFDVRESEGGLYAYEGTIQTSTALTDESLPSGAFDVQVWAEKYINVPDLPTQDMLAPLYDAPGMGDAGHIPGNLNWGDPGNAGIRVPQFLRAVYTFDGDFLLQASLHNGKPWYELTIAPATFYVITWDIPETDEPRWSCSKFVDGTLTDDVWEQYNDTYVPPTQDWAPVSITTPGLYLEDAVPYPPICYGLWSIERQLTGPNGSGLPVLNEDLTYSYAIVWKKTRVKDENWHVFSLGLKSEQNHKQQSMTPQQIRRRIGGDLEFDRNEIGTLTGVGWNRELSWVSGTVYPAGYCVAHNTATVMKLYTCIDATTSSDTTSPPEDTDKWVEGGSFPTAWIENGYSYRYGPWRSYWTKAYSGIYSTGSFGPCLFSGAYSAKGVYGNQTPFASQDDGLTPLCSMDVVWYATNGKHYRLKHNAATFWNETLGNPAVDSVYKVYKDSIRSTWAYKTVHTSFNPAKVLVVSGYTTTENSSAIPVSGAKYYRSTNGRYYKQAVGVSETAVSFDNTGYWRDETPDGGSPLSYGNNEWAANSTQGIIGISPTTAAYWDEFPEDLLSAMIGIDGAGVYPHEGADVHIPIVQSVSDTVAWDNDWDADGPFPSATAPTDWSTGGYETRYGPWLYAWVKSYQVNSSLHSSSYGAGLYVGTYSSGNAYGTDNNITAATTMPVVYSGGSFFRLLYEAPAFWDKTDGNPSVNSIYKVYTNSTRTTFELRTVHTSFNPAVVLDTLGYTTTENSSAIPASGATYYQSTNGRYYKQALGVSATAVSFDNTGYWRDETPDGGSPLSYGNNEWDANSTQGVIGIATSNDAYWESIPESIIPAVIGVSGDGVAPHYAAAKVGVVDGSGGYALSTNSRVSFYSSLVENPRIGELFDMQIRRVGKIVLYNYFAVNPHWMAEEFRRIPVAWADIAAAALSANTATSNGRSDEILPLVLNSENSNFDIDHELVKVDNNIYAFRKTVILTGPWEADISAQDEKIATFPEGQAGKSGTKAFAYIDLSGVANQPWGGTYKDAG